MTPAKPTQLIMTPTQVVPTEVVHGMSPRPAALSSTPDALALLKALRRRWVMALGLGLLAAAVIGTSAWYAVPRSKYTARATLHVATRPRRIMFEPKEGQTEYRIYQRTQIALLKDRKVISHALKSTEVSSLPTILEQVDADEWLEEQLKVDFAGGSEVLQVSLSGDRPDDLAKIVNAVVDSYMTLVVDQDRQDRIDRLAELRKLWERYQTDLDLKRTTLKDLAAAVGSNDQASIALAQQFRAEHLAVAQKEQMRAQTELLRTQAELGVIEADRTVATQSAIPPQVIDERVEQFPDVSRLRTDMEGLARQYQSAQRIARSANDPSVTRVLDRWQAVKKELEALRARLRPVVAGQLKGSGGVGRQAEFSRLREQASVWKSYRDALTKDIERLQVETKRITEKGLDLENERDELAIAADVSRRVGAEVEAVQVEMNAPKRVQLLSEAKVPKKKDELRKIKAGGAVALLAFVSALLGVSFWEFRIRRIDSVDEVVSGLGLRLVGALPPLPRRPGRRTGLANLAADRQWRSLLVESVDATRTMLLHASRIESVRTVMVTSAVKGEGKTSLACHLASSLARSGRRTLLLDCDLRRPTTHRLFDLPPGPGLCELLRGEAVLADVVVETPAANLTLIPAGHCDALALQALARDDLRALLEGLRTRYDFIIVDSAPVLPVADSLLLGQNVDAVIFSVLRDVSRLPMVYAAYERLARLGVKMLGAVVNGVQSEVYTTSYGPQAEPGR